LHSIIYVIHLKNLPYKTNNLYITPTPSKETALISLIAKKILTFPSASLISELSCLFSRVGDETSSSLTPSGERDYPNWSQNLALNGALWIHFHG